MRDRTLGAVALVLSCVGLGYLFVRLIVVPVLPLGDGNPFNLSPPIGILMTCGLSGLVFVGSLLIYTVYVLFNSNVNFKRVKADGKYIRH